MIEKVLAVDREENTREKKSETMLYLAGNDRRISNQPVTDDDIEVLCEVLSANTYVTALDLRYNYLTDVGAQHIAQLLLKSSRLSSLNLMCNDIGEEGAKHLAEALKTNTSLKVLRLTGNKIGNRGGLCFAQALQVNVVLESLDLGETDLETESLVALSTVLNYNQSLKALNVSRPVVFSVEEETTNHFARMLKTNETLQELHLLKHAIRDFGAARLADELQRNFTLRYLALCCNRITSDGARHLAELLKCNTALEVLDLSFNRIGDDGATAIATALALHNTHLKSLSVATNEISGQGLSDLADSLHKNYSVVQLFIWGNNLRESCCILLKDLLDIGRLTADNVDYRPYTDGDTMQLALVEVTNRLRIYH